MIKSNNLRDYIFHLIIADFNRKNKPLKRELGEQILKQLNKLSGTKEFEIIDCLLRMNTRRG